MVETSKTRILTVPQKPRNPRLSSSLHKRVETPRPQARAAELPLGQAPAAELVIKRNVTVQIVQGSITEETTDAIVNTTDERLVMGN